VTVNLNHFAEPPSEREVLRYALKDILTDYAEDHPALPFDTDDPNLGTLTDHRIDFGGNYSQLVSRLDNRFNDTSFEVNSDDHLSVDHLKGIFTNPSASYPLVEVHPELYEYQAENNDSAESYIVQEGHHDETLVPLLIPFSIEEGQVFYYDPFLDYYSNDTAPTQKISRGLFIELWGRCDLTSWSLWIDQGQQRTLMDVNEVQS
jgi:hypothetical protein